MIDVDFVNWASNIGHVLCDKKTEKLLAYADRIYKTIGRINLTGLKSKNEIISKLIIGSLYPILGYNVPRGTLFLDIGTGGGVPGVPFGIVNDHLNGILVDSVGKKINFVNEVILSLGLDNIKTINARLEDFCRSEIRGKAGLVMSRALGPIYLAIEFAAPLMAKSGFLFVYANNEAELDTVVMSHAERLGLRLLSTEERNGLGFGLGYVFLKQDVCPDCYPRRASVVKNEIQKLGLL
jgi:16S rRNA (guanine527-N7)-methyltransferase